MYHCALKICTLNLPAAFSAIMEKMPPLPNFTHIFVDESDIGNADAVFAYIQDPANSSLEDIRSRMGANACLTILATHETATALLEKDLTHVALWQLPLGEKLFQYHFLRWQESIKKDMDCWETRQFLQIAMDNSPNLIWFKNKSGIHEKVNAHFCQVVNKSREDVEGRGHAYIWDVEEDDPACVASEQRVMETGRTEVSEEIIQTGHGKRILTTFKSPLQNPDGSIMGTVGIGVDITQERVYAEKLLQKTASMEKLFKNMDCGVLCHTMDGTRILSVNDAALRILGYDSQAALQGANFDMVAASVLEEDKPILREAMRKLEHPGDNAALEYRVRRPNGDILHVIGNVKLVEENGIRHYQRFLLDCTDQKMREKRERQEHDRNHMELIQALSVDYSLVCVFNLNTGHGHAFRYEKSLLEKLSSDLINTDIDLDAAMGHYARTFVHPDDQEAFLRAASASTLRKELAARPTFYFTYRCLSKGDIRYFQMKAARVGERDNWEVVVVGFGSVDARIRRELEKKSQLEDALRQANRASRAKSVFLSNMSHDIRTPMNAIVGYTSLAIHKLGDQAKVMEYLRKINSSGNHLLNLINDILNMSHIESGKIQLEEKLVSLDDILQCLGNILQPQARAKNQTLSIDVQNTRDKYFYCDPLRLNQLLLNLLSNSIKYTRNGGVISLRVLQLPSDSGEKGRYEFLVRDNGTGMSEDFVKHIFEPFEREEEAIVSGVQGSGLGMAITKNIVDMMNGSIEVRSAKGEGSEFTVCLSFRLPKTGAMPIAPLDRKKLSTLILDNTAPETLANWLREWAFPMPDIATTPEEAEKKLTEKENYQLYILDCDMPGWKKIASSIPKSSGYLILIGHDRPENIKNAVFLPRPLDKSALRESLVFDEKFFENSDGGGVKPSDALKGRRILLVEDNEMNREIGAEILKTVGLEVETADNGRHAVEIVSNSSSGHFDLILMDVQMPIMNGFEATAAIRALDDRNLASIPIIAMTANTFEEDKRAALQKGMNAHVAKPINNNELFAVLNKFLA